MRKLIAVSAVAVLLLLAPGSLLAQRSSDTVIPNGQVSLHCTGSLNCSAQGQVLTLNVAAGGGNVTGPGSSAANDVAIFGDTTGTLLADGGGPLPANTTATSHQFFTAYTQSSGAFTKAQPACADLSDPAAGVCTFVGTPSSANLAGALTDETGSGGGGVAVFNQSPTIVTPTIASFANATHNHQNAAGGGSLDAAAIGSGTFAAARVTQLGTISSDQGLTPTNEANALAHDVTVGSKHGTGVTTQLSTVTVFTAGGSDAWYHADVGGNCDTTTASATVVFNLTYTDNSSTSQSVNLGTATCTTLGSASRVSSSLNIRVKAGTNVTASTVLTNAPTYSYGYFIKQLTTN